MDPAVYFNHYIFEEIFKYVPSKQYHELATVNKSWYEAITSSSLLMRSFFLGIRGDWMEGKDFEDIAMCSNRRNLRKVLMSDVHEIIEDVYEKILLNPYCYFTTVEIYGLNLPSMGDFVRIIKSFESSVKSLTLSNINIKAINCEAVETIHMENLRELEISFCNLDITASILKSARKLSGLDLQHAPDYDVNIFEHLKDMKFLKKVEMRGEWFSKFFKAYDGSVEFQLDEFHIACVDFTMPKVVVEKFLVFLETQKNLKSINISEWFGLEVLSCIFRMNTLKNLAMFISPFFRWSVDKLPQNTSLEVLDVRSLDVTDEFFNLLILLTATPNVKTLRLRYMNDALAYFIKIKLKMLTKIVLVHSHVSDEVKKILPDVEFA